MKVCLKQFLSRNHSWGSVGTSIAIEFKRLGHEVSLCSTNGYENFPKELEANIACNKCTTPKDSGRRICDLKGEFDLALSYTMLTHFPDYLKLGKNRFGIWNLDGNRVPKGFFFFFHGATKILPSSEYSRQTFENNGIPKDKMIVVPHGYSDSFVNRDVVYKLKTDRKIKVLVNIQQCHTRKNIAGILDIWGRTFNKKDDVVLVVKVKDKKPTSCFEVSWKDLYAKFKTKYKNHAPVMVINEFIDDISDLYRAVDIVLSASHVECFLLPAMEGLAAGKLIIASGGESSCGNIDFMNENNSLLIKGKQVRAPKNYQYWENSIYGEMFQPDPTSASELLLRAVKDYDSLIKQFTPGINMVREKYTWKKVAEQILSLCE